MTTLYLVGGLLIWTGIALVIGAVIGRAIKWGTHDD